MYNTTTVIGHDTTYPEPKLANIDSGTNAGSVKNSLKIGKIIANNNGGDAIRNEGGSIEVGELIASGNEGYGINNTKGGTIDIKSAVLNDNKLGAVFNSNEIFSSHEFIDLCKLAKSEDNISELKTYVGDCLKQNKTPSVDNVINSLGVASGIVTITPVVENFIRYFLSFFIK